MYGENLMPAFGPTDHLGRSGGPGAVARTVATAGVIAASVVIGVFIIELSCYLFVPSIARANVEWDRAMFLDGAGTIFQNHGSIFTYAPHNDVRVLTVYFSDRESVVEYDYRFHTNNYGLVQDFDVVPKLPSLLLLGDSFTEGLGAEPWFRQLAVHDFQYQLINGGLLATGFDQWSKLEYYLSTEENVQIRKLLVLFISGDYTRTVFNASQPALRCLQSFSSCRGYEGMYRLPPEPELSAWVNKLRAIRKNDIRDQFEQLTVIARLEHRARGLLPASYQVYNYLKTKFPKDFEPTRAPNEADTSEKQHSRAAITDFIEKYGTGNVAFMHLPQKNEMDGPSELGMEVRRAIQEAGGKLYDGFKLCGLTTADYQIHDIHPNKQGYGKIANCVGDVIQRMTAADQ
jgi:hypothetical protein